MSFIDFKNSKLSCVENRTDEKLQKLVDEIERIIFNAESTRKKSEIVEPKIIESELI